jgi:hypothetical protein
MGTVWRAWDELLDRDVAVKELRIRDGLGAEEHSKAYQRTHREARTAARLSHPGLVTVFDVAEEDGRPWIVMELVPAPSLDQVISREGPLPPQRAADVGRQLLAALATAHAAGVLHRDVKPSNVLLAEGGRAVLTDFGIATFEGDPALTQTGMVMGSPGFTAPERIQGNPATPASDLWSLGATLFAAVEGHGPFDRMGGAITTMSAVINEEPPSAPSAAALTPVIGALLRRNPADRPDAVTATRMLGAALGGSAGPYPAAGPDGQDPPASPGPPTSVDLPAQADRTTPGQMPAARPAPSGSGPARPAPAGSGAPPRRLPAPDDFAKPPRPGQPAGSTRPAGQRGPATRPTPAAFRAPRRRALISLGVLALVVAVAAAVMGLRAYRHPPAASPAGQVAAESAVAAAAAPPGTGPLPRGYQPYKLAGPTVGATAGYTVAIPAGWTAVSKGNATHFYAPGSRTYLEIDLTPHTYSDMLREARFLAARTQREGRFPGYRSLGIQAVKIHGTNAASWAFTWQDPGVGRVRALDLMYIASTPAGRQSYALYMSAPDRTWTRALAAFDEEMHTFQPEP